MISNQDPFNNATPIPNLGGLTEYQEKCDLSRGGFRSVEWLRLRSASAVWHAAGYVVIDTTRDVFKNFFRYPNDLSMLTPPLLKKLNQSVAKGNTHDSLRVTGVIRLFASRGDRRDRLSRDETNW
jgi:hypothetical protein